LISSCIEVSLQATSNIKQFCSMSNSNICVLGGSGFVGRHLCAALATQGYAVKVLSRRPERHRHLLVLPTVKVIAADIHNESHLVEHFQGCDAVINLVGILNEKRHDGKGFYFAHVELARKVINTCSTQGVARLLHMSALNASLEGESFYLRSKGEAENYVHNFAVNKIAVTSFRPSVIFGPEDDFVNRFAKLLKIMPGFFPLACADTKFSPVYVGDVAKKIASSLFDIDTYDQRINLCGPKEYSLKELVNYIASVAGYNRVIISQANLLSKLQAHILEYVPGKPFSIDNYNSLQQDSVCPDSSSHCSTSMESIVPSYLRHSNSSSLKKFRAKRYAEN